MRITILIIIFILIIGCNRSNPDDLNQEIQIEQIAEHKDPIIAEPDFKCIKPTAQEVSEIFETDFSIETEIFQPEFGFCEIKYNSNNASAIRIRHTDYYSAGYGVPSIKADCVNVERNQNINRFSQLAEMTNEVGDSACRILYEGAIKDYTLVFIKGNNKFNILQSDSDFDKLSKLAKIIETKS